MVIVTVEPGVILVIVKEKKPLGNFNPGGTVPQGVVGDALKLVIPPMPVLKVAVPVPVAVATDEAENS